MERMQSLEKERQGMVVLVLCCLLSPSVNSLCKHPDTPTRPQLYLNNLPGGFSLFVCLFFEKGLIM